MYIYIYAYIFTYIYVHKFIVHIYQVFFIRPLSECAAIFYPPSFFVVFPGRGQHLTNNRHFVRLMIWGMVREIRATFNADPDAPK